MSDHLDEFHEAIPEKLKNRLHSIEERKGMYNNELLDLTGAAWIMGILDYYEDLQKTHLEIINNLRKNNRRLESMAKGYTPKRDSIGNALRHETFKRDNYRCVECGATNKQTRLHVDHIVPVAQGGSDELDNLQTLCEECNLAKSSRKWEGI